MKRFLILLSVAMVFTCVEVRPAHARAEESTVTSKAVRIEVTMKNVYQWDAPSTRIRFFVETGSTEVPIICMADNAHFPDIVRYSARERRVDGRKGVVVDIYFREPVSPESHKKAAMSINLWQPNLTGGKYPVYPTNGKKIFPVEPAKETSKPRRK